MVEYLKQFETLSVLNSSLYDHLNVHIKPAYRRTSRKRQIMMMEAVNVLQTDFRKAFPYGGRKMVRLWDGEIKDIQRLNRIVHVTYVMV